ncbi:5182_t:CDS:2 [Gigaspora rosea]|nr:5182_t:CDS:2 [Gigaspora rosea]
MNPSNNIPEVNYKLSDYPDYYKLSCVGLLLVPCFILTFVCPVLDFEKIALFSETNGELKYNPVVEYS